MGHICWNCYKIESVYIIETRNKQGTAIEMSSDVGSYVDIVLYEFTFCEIMYISIALILKSAKEE